MKKLLTSAAFVIVLAVSTLAGEIPWPPGPPTCTENCGAPQSARDKAKASIVLALVKLLLP